MIISKELTPKLQKLVLRVEDDLRVRLENDMELRARWQSEHAAALRAERTSSAWVTWRDDRITQAAVGWVLTTVFLRFCEDNGLLSEVWISGPGARRQEAFDAENAYFRAHPENTWREWILEGVLHLRSFPATVGLVDEHAAVWQVSPSGTMAKEILDFWRATDEAGAPLYDFQDDELSTRFLGDLYQDLSEYAKKTFALLQTPKFVEEFILDQTLTPALAERPLEGFKLIDPTCGSGHFLLGGFQRLLTEWSAKAPNLGTRERVQKALDAIHGVDLNPFAVAIARFRLTIAALQATGELDLERAPDFSFHLATGDSLLHGQDQREFQFEGFDADAELSGFSYATEDLEQLKRILKPGQYDVVVGNPPYITVKDKTLNTTYRKLYSTCKGSYALSVPFMERFFGLAKPGMTNQVAGWTGQITSNSFMKREFGKKLTEEFLQFQDLTAVIDSEGAWIPGHNSDGTPTAIIVGRNQKPVRQTIRAVLSKGLRESRDTSSDGTGPYWQSIIEHLHGSDIDNEWVTITDLPREQFALHPWSLSGGGASALLAKLDRNMLRVSDVSSSIGRTTVVGEDESWFTTPSRAKSIGQLRQTRQIVVGEDVRDYSILKTPIIWWPYEDVFRPSWIPETHPVVNKCLWPMRSTLSQRVIFGQSLTDRNRPWYDHLECYTSKMNTPFSISFAEVSTHNHFVLDRDGRLFKQTAPIIKLPQSATEENHLELVGILNSSTVCFWLKQKSQPKGGASDLFWSRTYQFTGANVANIPLPEKLSGTRGRQLDDLAVSLAGYSPSSVVKEALPTASKLLDSQLTAQSLRNQMIAVQEELDWETYSLYEIIDEDLTYEGRTLPNVELGQRAFEIEIASRAEERHEEQQWFAKHGSIPTASIPVDWPADYKALVQRRIDVINSNPDVRLLERPEYKRRWATVPWHKQRDQALRGWLLDRLEDRSLWFDEQERPIARSIAQLADEVSRNSDLVRVLALWDGIVDVDVINALTKILNDEAVPYLAAQRLKEPGLRKREVWEETWDLQRQEDAGVEVGKIPAPPKYATADFRKTSWWQSRGKLDVPKERFILYPDAGRSTDPTLLLGWAGWDHVQQFLVLATIMDQRLAEGAEDTQLIPLIAGMAEVLPWVKQWHTDIDPTFGMSMADFCSAQLEERMTQLNVSTTELKAWRPVPATRGRRNVKEKA